MKQRGLGKGLSALVSETSVHSIPVANIGEQLGLEKNGVLMIAPEKILPSRYQPRKEFSEAAIEELSESIKKHGVIQPLIVSDLGNGTYELVAGERRLRASKYAQLGSVPVVVREYEEKDRLAVALIENIQREDLNAVEVAEAYKEMMDRLGLTQEDIGNFVGKSRTSVANTLRLLKLPQQVRLMIINQNISEGHGRALLGLDSQETMMNFAQQIENLDLSVRQTEELVRKYQEDHKKNTKKDTEFSKNTRIQTLEELLIRNLGMKTQISGNTEKGSIKIFYHTAEELENLTAYLMNDHNK